MMKIYRAVAQLSWALGVLSLLAAVILRVGHLRIGRSVSAQGGLEFAGVLFLCALATWRMARTEK